MTGNDPLSALSASRAIDNALADSDTDAIYHVRLVHAWPPRPASSTLDDALASSFFGLQLELRGTARGSSTPVQTLLSFRSAAPRALKPLEAITGPFELVVRGKLPVPAVGIVEATAATTDERVQASLQQLASVQIDNSLLEIDGEHFLLRPDVSGADVQRRLQVVAARASLARPFELTLRRHNHAQAVAKIVPFARRSDVQAAQLAQLSKLAEQEKALSVNVRRKKLFLVQQLDFEYENYLVAHVATKLQELHERVMGSGQWQAYEFSRALWYFHTPTTRLCAEHPMRSHLESRALVAQAQEQIQLAVRKLQRRTRSHQRAKRLRAVLETQQKREEDLRRQEVEIQEQRRLQLELAKQATRNVESETQTSSRKGVDEAVGTDSIQPTKNAEFATQTSARRGVQVRDEAVETELQEPQQPLVKPQLESETQTTARRGVDEAVDTEEDLDWQRYLTLLRVAVKNKKSKKTSPPKHCCTQTEDVASPLTPSSRPWQIKQTGPQSGVRAVGKDWRTALENEHNLHDNRSLVTLKSETDPFDNLDAGSPPSRTFDSFFAPEFARYPPPPLVETPWRQDSTFLPLKAPTVRLQEPLSGPIAQQKPIRPMRAEDSSVYASVGSAVTASSPTKLPYITRRRKKSVSTTASLR